MMFISANLRSGPTATVRLLANVAIAAAILAFASAEVVAEDMRDVLAPTGRLRVGVFPSGSLSMIQEATTGETGPKLRFRQRASEAPRRSLWAGDLSANSRGAKCN
jgi:sorbitol-specific phosphotransferase system component IIBC